MKLHSWIFIQPIAGELLNGNDAINGQKNGDSIILHMVWVFNCIQLSEMIIDQTKSEFKWNKLQINRMCDEIDPDP